MIGDFPILVKDRKEVTVHIPARIKDEIFQDHSLTVLLNHDDLQKLGYSRITE